MPDCFSDATQEHVDVPDQHFHPCIQCVSATSHTLAVHVLGQTREQHSFALGLKQKVPTENLNCGVLVSGFLKWHTISMQSNGDCTGLWQVELLALVLEPVVHHWLCLLHVDNLLQAKLAIAQHPCKQLQMEEELDAPQVQQVLFWGR